MFDLLAFFITLPFLDETKKIVDGPILNNITNKVEIVKGHPTAKIEKIIAKLFEPH